MIDEVVSITRIANEQP